MKRIDKILKVFNECRKKLDKLFDILGEEIKQVDGAMDALKQDRYAKLKEQQRCQKIMENIDKFMGE